MPRASILTPPFNLLAHPEPRQASRTSKRRQSLSFKYPELHDRKTSALSAKKAMLEKFRVAMQDPAAEGRRKERAEIQQARVARAAEREAAKKMREAERAAQAAREAELALQAKREGEAAAAKLAAEEAAQEQAKLAEQKAARDARYTARKAAKKVRRRGY